MLVYFSPEFSSWQLGLFLNLFVAKNGLTGSLPPLFSYQSCFFCVACIFFWSSLPDQYTSPWLLCCLWQLPDKQHHLCCTAQAGGTRLLYFSDSCNWVSSCFLSFVNSLKFYCCALKFRPPCLVDIYSWLWPLIYLSQNGVYDRGGSACQLVQGNLCQRQGCCPLFSSITHQYTIGGEVLVN